MVARGTLGLLWQPDHGSQGNDTQTLLLVLQHGARLGPSFVQQLNTSVLRVVKTNSLFSFANFGLSGAALSR